MTQYVAVNGRVRAADAILRFGAAFAISQLVFNKEFDMGQEDIAAGKIKQVKGKANDIAGAVTGDTAQQVKGKIQKGVGKVQEEFGKNSSDPKRDPK